ncbi:MAG: hypothetical protein COA94_08575 [Rickettsiales bacterium]|nr:MAG: hypothetical protein COA94_08575 [Rickettsiales bacterium]
MGYSESYPNKEPATPFLNLDQLSALRAVFTEEVTSFKDGMTTLQNALRLFQEYMIGAGKEDAQRQIQDYMHVLNQQMKYVEFFSEVGGAALPTHEILSSALTECREMLHANFAYQVKTVELEPGREVAYYEKAVDYLQQCPDSQVCKTKLAQAHVHMAKLANDDTTAAIEHYVAAIGYDKTLAEVYEKLGQLFQQGGEYSKEASIAKQC